MYLTSDVGVADNEAGGIEFGGSAVVCEFCVGEVAQFHVCGDDVDVESLVRRDILVVLGGDDQRRRHLRLGWNESLDISHRLQRQEEGGYQWNTVARTSDDLFPVRQCLARANVNEIGVVTNIG